MVLARGESIEQLPIAVGEHRVVERVLRVEVLVERRLAHPDFTRSACNDTPAIPCS